MNRTGNSRPSPFEYVIIGAGPAGICAIPAILKSGVSAEDICWIDPAFCVGDFGSILSTGSSVPGNTSVESYQRVNHAIYKIIPACLPQHPFELDTLDPHLTCTLKIAAKPLQHISDTLRTIVNTIEGRALAINSQKKNLAIEIQLNDGSSTLISAKRVILATGARAKTLPLPNDHSHVDVIDSNIAFVESALQAFKEKNPAMCTVAVIGSSHSAALAVMHLLKAGMTVKQFVNKDYLYAKPSMTAEGVAFTQFDNTGLKGEVASFTKQLIADIDTGASQYQQQWIRHRGEDKQAVQALLEEHLADCSHAVITVGYEPVSALTINGLPLSALQYDNETSAFKTIPGLFGIGIAFPPRVTSPSGEIEYAVGVGKFWASVTNPVVINAWKNNVADG